MFGNDRLKSMVCATVLCTFGLGLSACKDENKDTGGEEPCIGEQCDENNGKKEEETEQEEDKLDVGAACETSDECAGPGDPLCLLNELVPLEDLLASDNAGLVDLAKMATVLFPNNYCSTVAPCADDSECGAGGTCFLPLVDVDESEFEGLIDALVGEDGAPEDAATLKSFHSYGVCLERCETSEECTRPGYTCDVPLGEFVGILESAGARLETYCVGDPTSCDVCDEHATCTEPEEGEEQAVLCECDEGYSGDGYTCEQDVVVDKRPVGSACFESGECAGPGTPECILNELVPLESLLTSSNEGLAGIADGARVFFPNNYCSTVAPCQNDGECGEGGTCFLPLVDVDETEYAELIDLLGGNEAETTTLLSFREYGVCLEACDPNDGCDRPGYTCDVPIGDFVGLLENAGARMETYCIGDTTCDGCDVNATCDENVDPVQCVCDAEFEGDGYSCSPLDPECEPACDENATCLISGSGTACQCDAGFEGDGITCAPEATGCDPACGDNASCVNDTCACDANFEGDPVAGCTAVATPCAPNPCDNGGDCTEGSGDDFTCSCPSGFEGVTCEIELNGCDDAPCQNNGTCVNEGAGAYSCDCDTGFSGVHCEVEVNGCDDNPCANGSCTDEGAGNYSCTCDTGWEGTHCDTEINACDANPCVNGTCGPDGPGTYACSCEAGWEGENCDQPIDACLDTPCENNGQCTSTGPGTYDCACDTWWEGENCTDEVLACDADPCINGACSRTGVGTYSCECDTNWGGQNCDTPVSGCVDNPCQNGAACIDGAGPGEYTCDCPDGYEGNTCGTPIDVCADGNDDCVNGTCNSTGPGTFDCACAAGWEGAACDVQINGCDANPCVNGTCNNEGLGNYTCDCAFGYEGANCDVAVNACDGAPCVNGGTCSSTGPGTYDCACAAGYEGTNCEVVVNACEDLPCVNGQCSDTNPGEYTCACDFGYEGTNCDTPIDVCADGNDDCVNGTCNSTGPGTYACACDAGYEGTNCDQVIDQCAPNPCQNGGTCTGGVNTFTCDCPTGWEGVTCETAVQTAGTCKVHYDLAAEMKIRDTTLGAGDEHHTGINGQIILRLETENNQIVDGGTAEILYVDIHQDFTQGGGFAPTIITDVWAFAPVKDQTENETAVATGQIVKDGSNYKVKFPDCASENGWDSNKNSYTPSTQTTGTNCLNDYHSLGNVNCSGSFIAGCDAGNLNEGDNPQDDTWNQPLSEFLLSNNFGDVNFSAHPDNQSNREGVWMEIPNGAPSRTYMLWKGDIKPANSTCQNL